MFKLLLIIFLSLTTIGCSNQPICLFNNDEDIKNIYSSHVAEWQTKAQESFVAAELKIFNIAPTPKPNVVIGPNQDPEKCICKGTGIIVQGDVHKTVCPYHGSGKLKK